MKVLESNMNFKEQLKYEYKQAIEQQKQIDKIINELTTDFYKHIIDASTNKFNGQLIVFKSALKTNIKKNSVLSPIMEEMIKTVKKGEINYQINSDRWSEKDYINILNYEPSYTVKFTVTKSNITDFLKNKKYKDKFGTLPIPPIKTIIDKIYNADIQLNSDYQIKKDMLVSTKLKSQYLSLFREELCEILEDFLADNKLNYILDTEDSSDNTNDYDNWMNVYIIDLID